MDGENGVKRAGSSVEILSVAFACCGGCGTRHRRDGGERSGPIGLKSPQPIQAAMASMILSLLGR